MSQCEILSVGAALLALAYLIGFAGGVVDGRRMARAVEPVPPPIQFVATHSFKGGFGE